MEINLYLNVTPSLRFPYNFSIKNNSHCNLHFWKLKVISKKFHKTLPSLLREPEILYHRDLGAIGLTTKPTQMHTKALIDRLFKCACSGNTEFKIVNIVFNPIK